MKNKIVIIKIGSAVLLSSKNGLNKKRISHIADQIIALRKRGILVVLIASGAVACGASLIDRNFKEAAAGLGQVFLTGAFNSIFRKKGFNIAQILLTKNDLDDKDKRVRISETLKLYLDNNFIPLINENDVVEINSFKGNDLLAAEITIMLNADQLVILSTQKGSIYSVGGAESKKEVVEILSKKNIATKIVDGKIKNVLLDL